MSLYFIYDALKDGRDKQKGRDQAGQTEGGEAGVGMRVWGLCRGGDRFSAFLSPTTQGQGSAPNAQTALCEGRGPRSCGGCAVDDLRGTQRTGLPPPDRSAHCRAHGHGLLHTRHCCRHKCSCPEQGFKSKVSLRRIFEHGP